MVGGLQPNPEWATASGQPQAFAQGLWAGAGAILLLTFAGYLGEIGFVTAIVVTALLPGSMLLLAPLDILRTRRATTPLLSGAIIVGLAGYAAWSALGWILPSGLPTWAPTSSDAVEVAFPTVAGLALAAERAAARGRLAWRDRAVGASVGYLAVGGVFLLGVEWASWAVLLAVLPLRLARSSRVALAVLSGAAALGLGHYVDHSWEMQVAVETAAFVAYSAASWVLARFRPVLPVAAQALPAPG